MKYLLDDFDRKILRVLQDSPDMAVADIAQRVALSYTPCWRRIRRMEEEGIIQGRVTLINPAAIGYGIDVIASVKIKQQDEATLEAFEQAVRDCPQVVECFSMSGESDYLLRIVIDSIASYERLVKSTILHFPGVGTLNSSFALKRVKLTTKLPLW